MSNKEAPVFEVIATLNEHLFKDEMLRSLVDNGATIFRVNGSHVQPHEISRYAAEVRKRVGNRGKLLVDLPGNKIRTSVLSQPILLKAGDTFELHPHQINYPKLISHLKPGDELLANDSRFRFRVEKVLEDRAILYSFNDGELLSNKGVHLLHKKIDLPFLFERDHELIRQAVASGFEYIGLSFVRKAADVHEARAFVQKVQASAGKTEKSPRFIVKVETAEALENLDSILDSDEEFLVDRGDLSCDIGIENTDIWQKKILSAAQAKGKKTYFATQFLFSMVSSNVPLIAEVCALSDVIRCGISGLQLSEETAIGKHPLEVVQMVQKVLKVSRPRQLPRIGKKAQSLAPVFWFTGLSGSGKTTVSAQLHSKLSEQGFHGIVIDGDEFRAFWGNDAGYTKEERLKNQRNIVFTAFQSAASQGVDYVLVSSLSPYREIRNWARDKMGEAFHEVYVSCSPEACAKRDPKGHYQKAKSGGHEDFSKVISDYETPEKPELTLDTEKLSIDQSVEMFLSYVARD